MATPKNHPYTKFENTLLWKVVDTAISDLLENRDVKLSTSREYVVGYLCQQLARQRIVDVSSLSRD
jgi:hypothetical protein